uniref:Cytochrome P450 family 1 subfamily D member 1 n=1 Tax=Sphenodon punctatus TaxID=8508 RepID=A0A8D0HAU9_SPHPU
MIFDTEISLSEVTVALFTLVSILISVRIIRNMTRKHPFPPGPWSLPIVGNLLQIGEHPYITFNQMRKKYGDVFLIKMGMVPVVVVNGLDMVTHVLLRDGESFAGRPYLHVFSTFANGKSLSFSVNYGESWKLHKRIASKALRSFSKSEAKTSTCSCLLEEHVCAEALELVKIFLELSSEKGSFDPTGVATCTVANVVCALCFGKRYDHHDEKFLSMIKRNGDFLKASGAGNPADFIPFLHYLPLPIVTAALEFYRVFNRFVTQHIEDHFTTFDKNHLRDITDALISISNEKTAYGKAADLSNEKIINTVNDIFGAGFDTVSTCLYWIFLYLINNPDIQTKLQVEIDGKIGFRSPRFDDRKDMHYTEAFINEIFRHTTFIPFTIPHCATKDAILNGYFIPQNTWIFINMYQVNHDEALWQNPDLFRPERFLNESGELNKSLVEKVLIFGMGIRKCLGEDVARNEIFIILTTILQQLRLQKSPNETLDLTPVYGLSMKPKPYQIQALPRT